MRWQLNVWDIIVPCNSAQQIHFWKSHNSDFQLKSVGLNNASLQEGFNMSGCFDGLSRFSHIDLQGHIIGKSKFICFGCTACFHVPREVWLLNWVWIEWLIDLECIGILRMKSSNCSSQPNTKILLLIADILINRHGDVLGDKASSVQHENGKSIKDAVCFCTYNWCLIEDTGL